MLDVQYRAGMERYKQKRKYIDELQAELSNMEETLQNLSQDESARMQAVNTLEQRLATLNKELEDQVSKRSRANKQIHSIAKKMREEEDKTSEVSLELDVYIREQKEINALMLRKLLDCATKFPELENQLNALLHESGQALPKRASVSMPSSRATSKAQSASSSMVSSRSGSAFKRVSAENPPVVSRQGMSRGSASQRPAPPGTNYILASFDGKLLPKIRSCRLTDTLIGNPDDPAYIPRAMKERKVGIASPVDRKPTSQRRISVQNS